MVAGFQERASQEDQVEAVLPFITQSRESYKVTAATVTGQLRFKEREHEPQLLGEESISETWSERQAG